MKTSLLVMSVPLLGALSACTTQDSLSAPASSSNGLALVASATLTATDGKARGEARVTEASDGLHVFVRGRGLTSGAHAVHVHTTGNCTPPDFTSAGGHWNPTHRQHGKDNPAGMHMGDMPNMIAGADGVGELEYVIPGATLHSGISPLLDADGAAIVIHAQADDNRTDPAGNAGGRVACGVLSAAT